MPIRPEAPRDIAGIRALVTAAFAEAAHSSGTEAAIDGRAGGWHGLGPLAVRPDRQGRGIGQALVREGLARLRAGRRTRL